jgi:hypothetical protein
LLGADLKPFCRNIVRCCMREGPEQLSDGVHQCSFCLSKWGRLSDRWPTCSWRVHLYLGELSDNGVFFIFFKGVWYLGMGQEFRHRGPQIWWSVVIGHPNLGIPNFDLSPLTCMCPLRTQKLFC